ncbi:MAG: pirin family protein [bacterium]|nr:pirin family protein [bacterium]
MEISRRNAISMTAAGLIHIAGRQQALADAPEPGVEWLLRRAQDRGHTDLGWLKSYHSFSFGKYFDQRHMGFRSLRVINDDKIAPGKGFPKHPHRDMEIISYVLDGSLQHQDSTGQGAIITPNDVQMMSAGRGITHSEYNPSASQANHFLQIWIQPAFRGVQPRYRDNKLNPEEKRNRWKTIAGPEGSSASVAIGQDAIIQVTQLDKRQQLHYSVERGRHVWLQVARGQVMVNGTWLGAGDAVAASFATDLHLSAVELADVLLFDLG